MEERATLTYEGVNLGIGRQCVAKNVHVDFSGGQKVVISLPNSPINIEFSVQQVTSVHIDRPSPLDRSVCLKSFVFFEFSRLTPVEFSSGRLSYWIPKKFHQLWLEIPDKTLKQHHKFVRFVETVLQHNKNISIGLPFWAQYIPPSIYSRRVRLTAQCLIVLFRIIQMLWGIYQLYHVLPIIQEFFSPIVVFFHEHFQKTSNFLSDIMDTSTMILINFYKPLWFLFSSVFERIVQLLSFLQIDLHMAAWIRQSFDTLFSTIQILLYPITTTIWAMFTLLKSIIMLTITIVTMFRDILISPILYTLKTVITIPPIQLWKFCHNLVRQFPSPLDFLAATRQKQILVITRNVVQGALNSTISTIREIYWYYKLFSARVWFYFTGHEQKVQRFDESTQQENLQDRTTDEHPNSTAQTDSPIYTPVRADIKQPVPPPIRLIRLQSMPELGYDRNELSPSTLHMRYLSQGRNHAVRRLNFMPEAFPSLEKNDPKEEECNISPNSNANSKLNQVESSDLDTLVLNPSDCHLNGGAFANGVHNSIRQRQSQHLYNS